MAGIYNSSLWGIETAENLTLMKGCRLKGGEIEIVKHSKPKG